MFVFLLWIAFIDWFRFGSSALPSHCGGVGFGSALDLARARQLHWMGLWSELN